jgi:hypothetical protein
VSGLEWVGRETREELRRRRLGDNPACVICGETDRVALRRAARKLVEFHHLAGRANDPELGIDLCLNHHAILTEQLRDHGAMLAPDGERSDLQRLGVVLTGMGLALEQQGSGLLLWATKLEHELALLERQSGARDKTEQ